MSSFPNPQSLVIPNGWTAIFDGVTNSGFKQIVTISQNGETLQTFTGSGENNAQMSPASWQWTSNGQAITILFQADNGSGPYNVTVATASSYIGRTVGYAEYTTEDWVDGDNNDTVFSVIMHD